MKTIHKFLQEKINLKLEKKKKSCTLSKKRYVYFLDKPIEDAENHSINHYVSESFYIVLLNPNLRLKEIYYTKENLLMGTSYSNVQSKR